MYNNRNKGLFCLNPFQKATDQYHIKSIILFRKRRGMFLGLGGTKYKLQFRTGGTKYKLQSSSDEKLPIACSSQIYTVEVRV